MNRRWLVGVIAGIAADRLCVRKVLEQKRLELEKTKENLLVLSEWMALYRCGNSLEKILTREGYSAVAIYGMGILGSHLYQELEDTGIQVNYIIDRKPIKGVYESRICGIDTVLQGIDVVIVTPIYQFEEIKEKIQEINHLPVLSLRTLLDKGCAEEGRD